MSRPHPTLHLLCGKIAAGKSTLAAKLTANRHTVLISEDDWLSMVFTDQMATPKDYMRFSAKLRTIMAPHVVSLLKAGVSVVLDFQANTVDARKWMRGIIDKSGADHRLHLLAPPDEVCLARLKARNADGEHPFAPTEAQFWQVSKYFTLPSPEEGFTIVDHSSAD